ncbi:PLP-dependent aminotransferase family protein [Pelobacter seleniigenes]|uniref:aminotransferase-like domain-containing protein n=1 Tax=Pelobacter seleniigenes TaxID=407188 RepID=UPI0012B88210|nr:PLP-dependent aminotransferase family protein [Pelobacter seleniigenes]
MHLTLNSDKKRIALMAIWIPDLGGRKGPKYSQLVEAITDEIKSGTLAPGTRLPPHRRLAYALGISPNTTNRAYAECVSRGLLQGEIGRGTFVRMPQDRSNRELSANLHRTNEGPVDFCHNLPFPGTAAKFLSQTLAELSGQPGLQAFLDYQTNHEYAHHLAAGAQWLRQMEVNAAPNEIVLTCGAQHGILATLMALTEPGNVLLTEELSYAPVFNMAEHLGLKLHSVAMDRDGLLPEALEEACDRRAARVLYLMPTIQTPTTVTMSEGRRNALIEVARKHQLLLIEDDVYGPLRLQSPPPLALLAPERTIYISSCSKCLSPGLRVAFLRAPAALATAIRRAVTLSCWMPPPLMAEIAARWISDGTADLLTQAQRSEANVRQALAQKLLGGFKLQADSHGFHVWLQLPEHWQADLFCSEAARTGVLLTPGTAFCVAQRLQPQAVRISLSHEADRERVAMGLKKLAELLIRPAATSRPLLI